MGSSIVTMWHLRFALACSMMAASVVDLPLPVGPVRSTRPLGSMASCLRTCGSPSWSTVRTVEGISRNTAPIPFFCLK